MTTIGTIELIAKIDTSQYKKGASEINKANQDIEGSTESVDKTNKRANSGLIALAKKGLKVATIGMVGLGTAVTAMTLKGGFARAMNIEDAQAKLRGLGHDAKGVKTIMNNALSSVRGTAFGLDSAATTAANAVASGIRPGKQLEQVLKTVANTASLAGRDMSELGAIFNKVAASNKVQMDVINQLHDAGIPALALLSKEIGKSAEETAKMASDGKINFETFERAMRKGVGDAAVEMGNTTRGSLANMRAAFSRAGAIIADNILPHLRDSIQGITGWVDGVAKKLPGLIEVIVAQFGRVREAFDWMRGVQLGDVSSADLAEGRFKTLIQGFESAISGQFKGVGESIGKSIADGLNTALKALSIGMSTVSGWFGSIDWAKLGMAVGKQSVNFAVGFVAGLATFDWSSAFNLLRENWLPIMMGIITWIFTPSRLANPIMKGLSKIPLGKLLVNYILKPLRSLAPRTREAFGSIFNSSTGVIKAGLSRIGTVFDAFRKILLAPFRILDERASMFVRLLPSSITQAITSAITIARNLLTGFATIVRTIFTGIWNAITTVLRPLTAFFSNLFSGIWAHIRGIFSGAGNWFGQKFISAKLMIQNAIGGIVNWFGGRWAAIKNVFSRVENWFGNKFSGAWEAIKRAFSKVGGFFSNLWSTITKKFGDIGTKIGDKIGGAFKKVINQVLKGAVNIINRFIRAINDAIGVINNIPKVNIGKLNELDVPQLAKGGIVTSPTLAMIGEGGESEAVIPLSKLDKILANERNKGSSGGNGEPIIHQTNNVYTELDMNVVNRRLAWELHRA